MFSILKDKLNKNTFAKNVALIAGSTAAAQAITILCTPVVTRLYTPVGFGVLTVFAAILGVIGQLSTLRYSATIPLADDELLSDNVLKLCFLITVILSFLVAIIMFFFGGFWAEKYSVSQVVPYLWLLPICFLGTGLYEALSSWAIRIKNFQLIAQTNLSQGVSSSFIKIGLGLLGFNPLGLLLGLLASQSAGLASLFSKLIKEKPTFFRSMSLTDIASAGKRFSKFPLLQSWSRLLLSLGIQLPAIFMASFYGAETVGLFGLAYSMVNLPMNLLGGSVSQVYYAEISRYGKSRPDKIRNLSISVIKKMFFVGIIPMGAIMFAGPWMFSLVFGPEWYDAGVYARLLSIIILTRFIASPVAHCFDVFEMQGTQLFLNIVRVTLIIIIFIACKFFDVSSFWAVNVYGVLMSIYYAFTIIVIFIAINKFRKHDLSI